MDTEISELLSAAVPERQRPVDIADVHRRVRRRHRTRAAAAVLVLALAVPATINALPLLRRPDVALSGAPGSEAASDQPGAGWTRDGKYTVVHRFTLGGQAREVVAYRSRDGLCVETRNVAPPHNMGGGCGYGVPGEQLIGWGVSEDEAGVTVQGPVAQQVADVSVELRDGTVVDAGPYSGGSQFPVNFYLAAFPVGTEIAAVVGFDADGREIERQRVVELPPPLGAGEIGASARARRVEDPLTGATPRAAALALARELGREGLRVRSVLRVAETDTRVLINDSTGCWVYSAGDWDEDGTWEATGGDMPCDP
jgi:hypothetical protein